MNAKTVQRTVLGIALAAFVAMPAGNALAKDRDGDRDDARRYAPERRDHDSKPFWRHDDRPERGRVIIQVPPRPVIERRWTPGHYETRVDRVLVEDGHYVDRVEQVLIRDGYWQERCIPAVTEIHRDRHGRTVTVIVAPDRTERVWVPAVYETRTVRVWCPPQYEDREVRVWVDGCYITEPAPAPCETTGFSFTSIFGW